MTTTQTDPTPAGLTATEWVRAVFGVVLIIGGVAGTFTAVFL